MRVGTIRKNDNGAMNYADKGDRRESERARDTEARRVGVENDKCRRKREQNGAK